MVTVTVTVTVTANRFTPLASLLTPVSALRPVNYLRLLSDPVEVLVEGRAVAEGVGASTSAPRLQKAGSESRECEAALGASVPSATAVAAGELLSLLADGRHHGSAEQFLSAEELRLLRARRCSMLDSDKPRGTYGHRATATPFKSHAAAVAAPSTPTSPTCAPNRAAAH